MTDKFLLYTIATFHNLTHPLKVEMTQFPSTHKTGTRKRTQKLDIIIASYNTGIQNSILLQSSIN